MSFFDACSAPVELEASYKAGGAIDPNLELSAVVDAAGIAFRSLEVVLTQDGRIMPGEHDDMDVGVVSRLLHGPAEPEYWVDGLATKGMQGVEEAVRFEAVAAANAFNSGIRAGGRSPERLFGSIVGESDSERPVPRIASLGTWRSSGRDLELRLAA